MRIVIIDGQGGGIGRYVIEQLRKAVPDKVEILALATNAVAVASMLKAGANDGASGENAIVHTCQKADVIIGPLGIIMANAMLGEVTPKMAEAVASSPAKKILLPVTRDNAEIAGLQQEPLPHLVADLVERVKKLCYNGQS